MSDLCGLCFFDYLLCSFGIIYLGKCADERTIISPTIIAIAPALIGDARLSGREAAAFVASGKKPRLNMHICTTVMPIPVTKLVHTAAFVTFALNSP